MVGRPEPRQAADHPEAPALERPGPDVLLAENPRLVIARVSGEGQTGPRASRPGFAATAEALGGLRYLNGFPGGPPPRFGLSMGDSLGAMFAFAGIMTALHWRDSAPDGRGQVVNVALTEGCLALLESTLPDHDRFGVVRSRPGPGSRTTSRRTSSSPRTSGGWSSPPTPTPCSAGWPRRCSAPSSRTMRASPPTRRAATTRRRARRRSVVGRSSAPRRTSSGSSPGPACRRRRSTRSPRSYMTTSCARVTCCSGTPTPTSAPF